MPSASKLAAAQKREQQQQQQKEQENHQKQQENQEQQKSQINENEFQRVFTHLRKVNKPEPQPQQTQTNTETSTPSTRPRLFPKTNPTSKPTVKAQTQICNHKPIIESSASDCSQTHQKRSHSVSDLDSEPPTTESQPNNTTNNNHQQSNRANYDLMSKSHISTSVANHRPSPFERLSTSRSSANNLSNSGYELNLTRLVLIGLKTISIQ